MRIYLGKNMQIRWFRRRGTVEHPSSSPVLTPVNFLVLGFVKDKVDSKKPEAIAKMRVAIEKECAQIPEEMVLNVSRSISSSYKKRIE